MTHEVSRNRCPWDTFKESNYREEEKKPLHIAKATIDVYNYKNIIIKKKTMRTSKKIDGVPFFQLVIKLL